MLKDLSHDGGGFDEEKALKTAFDNYFPKYRSMAFNYVRNWQDADDIAIKAIERLWNKGRKLLPDEDKVRGFLYKVTMHLCIDYLRRQKRSRVDLPGELDPDLVTQAIERHFTRDEIISTLNTWIEKSLSGRAKEVIIMFFLKGMTNEEIAEALGMEVQSVYNYKSQALKVLKEDVPLEIWELWSNLAYLILLAMQYRN